MATLKHINSKNADYGAAEQYLLFEHDEFTMKPVLDETGRLIPREDYRLSTLNCGGEDFAVACMRANLRYGKNQRREDVKSHHYIISFDPRDGPDNGLTVDRAQALGEKFCAEHFPGHQALVCTHPDGHNHSGNMQNRFFNMNLAGGAMLDIGVYALSIVRSFMEETPTNILSQWKPSPTGSDEQATVLLQNSLGQMATVALSMHSKQPKRAMISCEKGYIEIMEYPRADKAVIVDAETGARTEVAAGSTADALYYEMLDMEHAVQTRDASAMCLGYSRDVMDIMTRLRKEWGMKYPGEEWD